MGCCGDIFLDPNNYIANILTEASPADSKSVPGFKNGPLHLFWPMIWPMIGRCRAAAVLCCMLHLSARRTIFHLSVYLLD